MINQLGVKALTVEDLLQAQKEISAHNRQLKEQTKQLERDMSLLRDHSLLLVSCIMSRYHPHHSNLTWLTALTIHGNNDSMSVSEKSHNSGYLLNI